MGQAITNLTGISTNIGDPKAMANIKALAAKPLPQPTSQNQPNAFQKAVNLVNPFSSSNIVNSTENAANNFTQNLSNHLYNYIGGAVQNVAQTDYQSTQNIANDINQAGTGQQQPISAGLQTAGEFGKMVSAPISATISPIVQAGFNGLNKVIDFIQGQPQGTTAQNQAFNNAAAQQRFQQISDAHPELSKNLEAVVNIIGALGTEQLSNQIGPLENIPGNISKTFPATEQPPAPEMTAPAPKAPKTTLEMQNAQGNVQQAQTDLTQAQTDAQLAQQARQQIAPQAVEGASKVQTGLQSSKAQMGSNFGNAATQVEQTDPTLRLNLTNEQLTALNDLKQGKNFALPDKLDMEKNPTAMVGGKPLDLSTMNPKVAAQIKAELGNIQGETGVSLSPTEAQDLITRLNGSTYKEVGGTLQVDQQRIALTNEIKNAAQSAFGHITDENGNSIWNEAYQNYAQGSKAIQSFENLLNLKPKSTPNQVINNILKLDTPEQQLVLQNMVENLQNSPAKIDLTDPIKTIQQIADKQTALDEANSALSDAQKALRSAQRAKDVLGIKEEIKNATFSGRHPQLSNILKYEVKRAAWGATGGLIMSVFVYNYARKLLQGK